MKQKDNPLQGDDSRVDKMHGTVDFLLRRIRMKGDLPSFSKHITEINRTLSSLQSINYSSSRDLANFILKDVSLTSKLLKIVNSAFYGDRVGNVTTISRATFLLGFEKLRQLTSCLIIFEQLKNKNQTTLLQECALSSFMSATVAKEIAANIMIGESEELFVCALMHNLGQMLVICYFPEEYEEIRKRVRDEGISEVHASKSILGIPYYELGKSIGKAWKLPDIILDCMDESVPDNLGPAKTKKELFRELSNFSNVLCRTVLADQQRKIGDIIEDLTNLYQKKFDVSPESMMPIVEKAADNVGNYSEILKIDSQQLRYLKNIFRHEDQKTDDTEKHPVKETVIQDAESNEGTQVNIGLITRGLDEINDVIKNNYNLPNIIQMITENIYRCFNFNRVIFCMLNQTKTRMIARFGFGEEINPTLEKFNFDIVQSSDLFNSAVARRADLFIDDASVPKFKNNLPDWYKQNVNAAALVLIPLVIKEKSIGLFYAERKNPGVVVTDTGRYYMKMLISRAVVAIMHTRVR